MPTHTHAGRRMQSTHITTLVLAELPTHTHAGRKNANAHDTSGAECQRTFTRRAQFIYANVHYITPGAECHTHTHVWETQNANAHYTHGRRMPTHHTRRAQNANAHITPERRMPTHTHFSGARIANLFTSLTLKR